MDGPLIINVLIEAEVIKPGVNHVRIEANADGYYSVTVEGEPTTPQSHNEEELNRLRLVEKLASKMVRLQLDDGQVDDRLAEQVSDLINPARGQET